jgi:hypothetical protein
MFLTITMLILLVGLYGPMRRAGALHRAAHRINYSLKAGVAGR